MEIGGEAASKWGRAKRLQIIAVQAVVYICLQCRKCERQEYSVSATWYVWSSEAHLSKESAS